jgi:hypothetical protein
MGEVYRADDLTLGQPVALKFLPFDLATDADRLARFRMEVAAARKVSHPNVCRVYDIIEWRTGGLEGVGSFLTMEFIDGEDLSSLLKRLGRVPEEKGVEIARQLCAALAAVHDQGLLHRDLKPANVMLDGRGKVRLTDFGLAAAAEDLSASEVRRGTPLYQAPEQLAGKEVTVRSDLYALGLLLYELFTGKRAFPDSKRGTLPLRPSSRVSGFNPVLETVILRCLEPAAADRPRDAYEVLTELPGADPLAAALAAGETPSPRLVVNAPIAGTLDPRLSLALFASVVGGLILIAFLNSKTSLARQMPLDRSPRELTRDARAILAKLSLTVPNGDKAQGFYEDYSAYLRELNQVPPPSWNGLRTGEPPLCYFWYRESPTLLVPSGLVREGAAAPGLVTIVDPAMGVAGEVCALFDLKGRLLELHAVSPYDLPEHVGPPEGGPLLTAAGLDPATLKTDPTPRRMPHVFADARAAWTGTYPDRPDRPVRVEAALRGEQPVYFYIGPEDAEDRCTATRNDPFAHSTLETAVSGAVGAAIVLADVLWLMRRNLVQGRADLRGAGRFATAVLAIHLIQWAMTAHHVARLEVEVFGGFAGALGQGVLAAMLVGVGYLALKPGVRRRWPERLVAWSRLLDGQWRNPLVGRDLLVGAVGGVVLGAIPQFQCLATRAFGYPIVLNSFGISAFIGGGPWIAWGLLRASTKFLDFYLLLLLTVLTRRQWLGAAVWFGLLFMINIDSVDRPLVEGPFVAAEIAVTLYILMRFGVLAYLVAMSCRWFLFYPMFTLDVDAWHALNGAIPATAILLIAAIGCRTATGGQRVFGKLA